MVKYLAYGSNIHPIRIKQRTPSAKFYRVVSLKGYKLKFHKIGRDGSGKCNILFTENFYDLVYGVVYEISKYELKYLDAAENLGHGYTKKFFHIEGIKEEVFAYIAQEGFIDDSLRPYSWYKALVLEGAKYFNLPRDYIEMIEAVDTIEDFNKDRVKQAMNILKGLKKADHFL